MKAARTSSFLKATVSTDPLSLDVALVCRILGDRATLVFSELTNGLGSQDSELAEISFRILLNCGPPALGPLMEFYSTPGRSSPVRASGGMRDGIETMVMADATEMVPALCTMYERGDQRMRAATAGILEDSFYDLPTRKREADVLVRVLKPKLQSPEAFIRIHVLEYLGRCGSNAASVVPQVRKLLTDSDLMVRSKATNTLNSIQPKR
jgi:hypothetical protein